jgi:hypothetical protein
VEVQITLSIFSSCMLSPLLDDFTEICRLTKFRNFIVEFSYTALNISYILHSTFPVIKFYNSLIECSTLYCFPKDLNCQQYDLVVLISCARNETYAKKNPSWPTLIECRLRICIKLLNYKLNVCMAYFSLSLGTCVFRNDPLQTVLPSINMSYSN